MRYRFYLNKEEVRVKDLSGLINGLTKDKRIRDDWFKDLAFHYVWAKAFVSLKFKRIINITNDNKMNEAHIQFVNRLIKDFPELKKYIQKEEKQAQKTTKPKKASGLNKC